MEICFHRKIRAGFCYILLRSCLFCSHVQCHLHLKMKMWPALEFLYTSFSILVGFSPKFVGFVFFNVSPWYRAHGAAKWFVSKESNRRFQPLVGTHVHRTLTRPHFLMINVTSSTGYTERLRFLPHPWLHHQRNIINGLHGTFTLPSPPPAPSSM